MKKYLLVVLPVLAFSNILSAQKIDESKVPALVKQAFIQKYPGVSGKWEKEDVNYEVNFKNNNSVMSAVIDTKGTILETETDIAVKDLPTAITEYIKSHYKGAAIKEAALIVKAGGESMFEAEVNKMDLLFDRDGKFIKEVKD